MIGVMPAALSVFDRAEKVVPGLDGVGVDPSFFEERIKAYAPASVCMANWMAAKVMKAASVSARFS